ncbi:putative RNA polymerase II subunit B1 CTD phosphatase RPAP2 [Plutella xylostella]|uniref:putative RNA polymerase II subunit B1 CTD phosphatase RPAP2 n=1 Tax=Plutella xylostella TaxID=51655 RepID=UPI0020324CD0|nr:putative RNA polymerase II subunit B1 CTD phosphatase RPAP2 [Plutella xylostella]
MESQAQKPRKKPTKIEEMSKEQIRQAILKKRECNNKAQAIVESLLEKNITDEFFLRCLNDINQSHLEDVIEERSIIHLCGYPLCTKPLSVKDIPKQKYRISMKTNKVYDITARKSFCSNKCYESAMHIKKQMLTSPLWFREYEVIPKFHLMPVETAGSMGQEVDVALIERVQIQGEQKHTFTSINDFTSASLSDMNEDNTNENSPAIEVSVSDDMLKSKTETNKDLNVTDKSEVSNDARRIDNINEGLKSIKINSETKTPTPSKKPKPNPLNIVGDVIEKPEQKIDPILTDIPEAKPVTKPAKKVTQKKQPSVTAITIEVEKSLAEWCTLDTMLFLFGEEKVKEMVTDKGECIKDYLNNYAKSIFYTSNSYDQYQALCRKLNVLELEDKKLDSQILQRETKPLPDYSILQEESKKLQLKVKAFYSGETDIPVLDTNTESPGNVEEEDGLTVIPLVDKNAQNALRRKIVCNQLNKVLPDLLRSLGLLTLSISSDVRLLVNTFKLRADNIMFKPIQWTLIAIIIIKMLSLRDERLRYLLQQPTSYKHMQLLLLSYKQEGGYLDRLISWLTDVDRLLDTNDIQLTVDP